VNRCQQESLQIVTASSVETFGDRLKKAFTGLSNRQIAEELGVSKSAVTNYMQGRIPPPEMLDSIARLTKCSLHWLITGEGPESVNGLRKIEQGEVPIYFGPKEHEIIQKLASESKRTFEDEVRELLLERLEEMGLVTTKTGESNLIFFGDSVPKMIDLPFLGEIAAGEPLMIFPRQEKVSVPDFARKPNRKYMVLRVRGDSMVDDNIPDGSLIVCEATNTANAGQTIVAVIDGEAATVKKYYPEHGRIRLQPANPAHLPQYVSDDRLKIQGIVVVIFHKPA
jgi:repressor LexA